MPDKGRPLESSKDLIRRGVITPEEVIRLKKSFDEGNLGWKDQFGKDIYAEWWDENNPSSQDPFIKKTIKSELDKANPFTKPITGYDGVLDKFLRKKDRYAAYEKANRLPKKGDAIFSRGKEGRPLKDKMEQKRTDDHMLYEDLLKASTGGEPTFHRASSNKMYGLSKEEFLKKMKLIDRAYQKTLPDKLRRDYKDQLRRERRDGKNRKIPDEFG